MIKKLIFLAYLALSGACGLVQVLFIEDGMDLEMTLLLAIWFGMIMVGTASSFVKNLKFYRSPEYTDYEREKAIEKEIKKIEKRRQEMEKRQIAEERAQRERAMAEEMKQEKKVRTHSKAARNAALGVGAVAYITLGTVAKLTSKYK